jgi:glycosyltransferase involved in cell wall biosynthesis
MDRLETDVVYSPAYIGPFLKTRAARLTMIHDDLLWSQPTSYPPRFRLYMKTMMRLSARTAERLVHGTEDARKRLARRVNIPAKRSGVVPHGVDLRMFRPGDLDSRLPEILCLASAEPRKNHEILIEALKNQNRLRLRFVGVKNAGEERLASWRSIDGGRNWEVAEASDQPHTADELRRAAMLALPSLGEGFGLPVIEAMATGTPLVLSDIPVFQEVAGEAALYVNPRDAVAWRDAIQRTAARGADVEERVRIGLDRVQRFSLDRVAMRLLKEAHSAILARRART